MRRWSWVAAIVVGGILCAGAGFAQQSVSGSETFDPEGGAVCFCGAEEGTGAAGCVLDAFCSDLVQCTDTSDCAAGETCLSGDNCCGVPVCAAQCTGDEVCPGPPGTCGTYELCIAGVPTMGQWGLAGLAAMIGLGALFLVWNKRGFATPAAFLLLVIALSLGAYAVVSIGDTLSSCEPVSEGDLAAALFLDE